MLVGLFVPCYVDQFYPKAAIATLELLEKLGVSIEYPKKQTCCGQPMANSGFEHLTDDYDELFTESFYKYYYVVAPSGSCVLHLKEHLHSKKKPKVAEQLRGKIYELVEFLTDVLQVKSLKARFRHVGVHQSCHGLRGLKLLQMSELVEPHFSKPEYLLSFVEDLQLIDLKSKNKCCGFGGTFCG